MNELQTRIAAYVEAADRAVRIDYERNGYTFEPPPTHRADYISPKWCRIVQTRHGHEHGSAYAFVCLQDGETKTLGRIKAGDIHKPASWSAPARHARGSVFAADFGTAAGPHGPAYLVR